MRSTETEREVEMKVGKTREVRRTEGGEETVKKARGMKEADEVEEVWGKGGRLL